MNCCICNPRITINADLCRQHKNQGLLLAKRESIRFIDAADRLYWEARDKNDMLSLSMEI